jgi:hypothetical protein
MTNSQPTIWRSSSSHQSEFGCVLTSPRPSTGHAAFDPCPARPRNADRLYSLPLTEPSGGLARPPDIDCNLHHPLELSPLLLFGDDGEIKTPETALGTYRELVQWKVFRGITIRRFRNSPSWTSGLFVVANPTTATAPFRMCRRGSNPPDRSSSYSRRNRSCLSSEKTRSAIAS